MTRAFEVETSSVRYDDYRFLYPVRAGTDAKIPSSMLGFYEKRGWVAQVKKNGTSNVIAVAPPNASGERVLHCSKRDGEPHSMWAPTASSSRAFQNLPGKGWWVFVSELLHSKVEGGPKDTNYLHDCLVADGAYLIGSVYAERYDRLTDAFPIIGETEDSLKVNDHTFILANFMDGFKSLFNSVRDNAADEGLVLKNPQAALKYCVKEEANKGAQIKCRHRHARSGSF